MTPVFLINLDDSSDRLASARTMLDAAGLGFVRIPAVDGRRMAAADHPAYDRRRARRLMGRDLRGGEIGCYLSHLAAARAFLATGAPVGVVFEDDLRLLPAAAGHLRAVLADLAQRPGWDLVNIGPNKHRIFTPLARFGPHVLTAAHYFPMTTTGLIWSRAGARAFVDGHDRIFAPVDNFFRHWLTRTGRGLAVWPPLVTTTGAESEIEAGSPRRSVTGRHPLYGLIKQRRLLVDKIIATAHRLRQRRTGP